MEKLTFINYINDHYDELYGRFEAFCHDKKYTFSPDIFQETILKCYYLIEKNGLKDSTPRGIENYFFMAFKTNLQREALYARNLKRDKNIINLTGAYEEYSNTLLTQAEKLKSDLWKDFSTLYLMLKVEDNFDAEHFYLFRLKTFDKKMTYAKLQETTGLKGCRQKVVDVRNWLRENVTKEEIDKAFNEVYGNIL